MKDSIFSPSASASVSGSVSASQRPARSESCPTYRRWLYARTPGVKLGWLAVVVLSALLLSEYQPLTTTSLPSTSSRANIDISRIQKFTVTNLHQDLSFLDNAEPISTQEFLDRRTHLAAALHASDVAAFILEPGYTFQYYGNVSQVDWEPWEPEERPFLMVVMPVIDEGSHEIDAKSVFLAPAFEESRVRLLGIPSEEELEIVTWEEHWDPYLTLWGEVFENKTDVRVMVDEEMRDYIVRGLQGAGFETVGLGAEVKAVRQRKSAAEIEILRAVNTGTVEAIRAMRPCLVPGLTENEVASILDDALLSVGFQTFFDIVLFDENAALPHGGVVGNKVLNTDTMVLIDVGAHYLGYSSDVARSFFIAGASTHDRTGIADIVHWLFSFDWVHFTTKKEVSAPHNRNQTLHDMKLKIWDLVSDAQTASMTYLVPNSSAASVDIAARDVISNAGFGKDFTHRVGHGIGIKAHESPYLHKGNIDTKFLSGMTFTSEPGVYLEGLFGVRTEDVFLIREDEREPERLSGRRARSPWDP